MAKTRKHTPLSERNYVHLVFSLFGADLLDRVLEGVQEGCRKNDTTKFGLANGLEVDNEIQRSCLIACAAHYSLHLLPAEHDEAVKEFAIAVLSNAFNYAYRACNPAGILPDENAVQKNLPDMGETPLDHAEAAFPITALLSAHPSVDALPLLVVGRDVDLDHAFAFANGMRKAPFLLMQEFLNRSPRFLWGIVTNGSKWRLLRDNSALSRPCYLEFDFDTVLAEKNAAAFAGIYRMMHSSRAQRRTADDPASCLWEDWHRELEKSGQRVREGLRDGVEQALVELGTGFLRGRGTGNDSLRAAVASGVLGETAYFNELMRLVYRFIFLFVTEERGLLHLHSRDTDASERYARGYSMHRLKDRCLRPDATDRHADVWLSLQIVFRSLARDAGEPLLALPGLGGLFAADQCPRLDACSLPNSYLLKAVELLRWARIEDRLSPVDYRNMGAEELGSIYESLLELTPCIHPEERAFSFRHLAGNERKTTGSYYTPACLVQEMIRTALEPLIRERMERPDPASELLKLRIIDPSCGSGHFLLAAARRLAEDVARCRAPGGQYTLDQFRDAMHQVVSRCIYGIDLNPMAVELVRMNLWLEGYKPGKPLGFLDAHLVCGNTLLGVDTWKQLDAGIPADAYKPLPGDDPAVCAELKKQNRASLREYLRPGPMLAGFARSYDESIEELPEETPAQVERKRQAYRSMLDGVQEDPRVIAADVLVGAFLLQKTSGAPVPTTSQLNGVLRMGIGMDDEAVLAARRACEAARVLHWPMRFAPVMNRGGFDCVLGNPPWEKIKIQELEWFAARHPQIAAAAGNERKQRIRLLEQGMLAHTLAGTQGEASPWEKSLHIQYAETLHDVGAFSRFVHVGAADGGRFPLTGVGDVNLYALFAECFLRILSLSGRAGFVVPTGIATDDSTKAFFRAIVAGERLASLYDFENREKLFPAVDSRQRFACITLAPSACADFCFYLKHPRQLADERRHFSLTAEEFATINPNTETCPLFRCSEDARLAKKIYARVPIFMNEASGENPWDVRFSTMFHMTNDSSLFLSERQDGCLPLYEGKMIHQYDHRWATYMPGGDCRDVSAEEKANASFDAAPRYWVRTADVLSRLPEEIVRQGCLLGFRDITNATNERTMIAGLLPLSGAGHTLPLMLIGESLPDQCCLLANLNSLVLDYMARIKVGGIHMTYHYLRQFPVLPPSAYSAEAVEYIGSRVLRLCYTSESMRPFALGMGYEGDPFVFDEEERAGIRAELDAVYARLYGLTRRELEYILDPATLYGEDCPTVTFPGLRANEIKRFGEYRTQRLVLEAFGRVPDFSVPPAVSPAAGAISEN